MNTPITNIDIRNLQQQKFECENGFKTCQPVTSGNFKTISTKLPVYQLITKLDTALLRNLLANRRTI